MFADTARRLRDAYLRLDGSARLALVVLVALYLVALLAPLIAPYEPGRQLDIATLNSRPPSAAHPFGTDRFSRDVLSRVLYGARISLSVATLAVILSAIVGTLYGLVAAVAGGVVDTLFMRVLDALLAIPRVLLLMAVLALWSPVPLSGLIWLLGLTGWFEVSRLVRAEALSIREREYVVAARSLGANGARVALQHILPNVTGPIIVNTVLGVGSVIMLEAGLSFIGIGAREPDASWGTMFSEGTEAFTGMWWLAFFPGLAMVATVLCVNILGDALRIRLDPRKLHGAAPGTRSAAAAVPVR